jgi:UDP:flavonoid glycosyltransferase YjiC (YdhE family)
MVVIPFVSDQPVNAECVERLGVGKCLLYKHATKSGLKHTVFSVLRDENIKANLLRVREWIKQSPGNKGGAEMIIEYYETYRKDCYGSD